jgi:cation:H+ antiporter
MLLPLLGGLALLVVGGELLVRGASRLAAAFGIPPLVIGLTVVAFGTSAPEMAVSVSSAIGGKADIAYGNVAGSNIFNVLFILGASALVAPLAVSRQLIWQEVPVMIGVSLLAHAAASDGTVGRIEGLLGVAALAGYTFFLVRQAKRAEAGDPEGEAKKRAFPLLPALFSLLGLGVLVVGADLFVEGAVAFAKSVGVSDLVIGLTIVAGGTSLPEVATSILATVRGHRDIAVGNVVGSSVFNLLGVLGVTASVAPEGVRVAAAARNFDNPVMLATAFACLPIFFTGHRIARWEGVLFLFYYAAYVAFLVLRSAQHDALPHFSRAMAVAVLPLTVLTLGVVVLRAIRANR